MQNLINHCDYIYHYLRKFYGMNLEWDSFSPVSGVFGGDEIKYAKWVISNTFDMGDFQVSVYDGTGIIGRRCSIASIKEENLSYYTAFMVIASHLHNIRLNPYDPNAKKPKHGTRFIAYHSGKAALDSIVYFEGMKKYINPWLAFIQKHSQDSKISDANKCYMPGFYETPDSNRIYYYRREGLSSPYKKICKVDYLIEESEYIRSLKEAIQ